MSNVPVLGICNFVPACIGVRVPAYLCLAGRVLVVQYHSGLPSNPVVDQHSSMALVDRACLNLT